MEASDWVAAAENYQQEVSSVFDRDRKGRVRALIRQYGSKEKSCLDLGCGPGRFLPLLAEHFGEVHACDYSQDMLDEAQSRAAGPGITFECCDLRESQPARSPADVVLCVNALLHPQLEAREAMWRHLADSVATGGVLILVVPALESALLSRHRLVEWNLRSGLDARESTIEGFEDGDPDRDRVSREGLMDAGGTVTKHYLKEELRALAHRFQLQMKSCKKIKYDWDTEFHQPPRWMKAPYPWDWLVVAGKSATRG